MDDLYFEDFFVGQVFESGPAILSEEEIAAFAERYAPLPYHTGRGGAEDSAFGGVVAPGYQTAALTFGLFVRTGALRACGMGSPGIDRLRWLAPVRAGDALTVKAEIVEVSPARVEGGRDAVRIAYETRNQRGEAVMTLTSLHFVRRRPRGAPEAVAARIRVFANPRYEPGAARPVFDVEAASAEITTWPGYAPTPLVALPGLAAALGVEFAAWKDESGRFGLGSFKALGGAYAVGSLVERHGGDPGGLTFAAATDGNHGRSVAWGARRCGAKAAIFVPGSCSPAREAAIAAFGARVARVDGGHSEAVDACARAAREHGWIVVADTAEDPADPVPALVASGYSVMVGEALDQWSAPGPPTHMFVQAGVGALAAAVCETLRARRTAPTPRVVVVEPEGAACLVASVRAGRAASAPPPVRSVMAGLDCGRASAQAWRALDRSAFAFATVDDGEVGPAMRLLARPPYGDPPIVAGESAVAGLLALAGAMADPEARRALALDRRSRVLLFGTEGATDLEIYRRMVGAHDGGGSP